MHIHRFSIRNYKCFRATDPIEFSTGINIITGQNNAGKTAFLEALSLSFPSKPHRSLTAAPNPNTRTNAPSTVDFVLRFSGADLPRIISGSPNRTVKLFLPDPESPFERFLGVTRQSPEFRSRFIQALIEQSVLNISATASSAPQQAQQPVFTVAPSPAFGLYETEGTLTEAVTTNLESVVPAPLVRGSEPEIATGAIVPYFRQHLYVFRAHRPIPDTAGVGPNAALSPELTNLAEVLNLMQSNSAVFEEFNRYVTGVLPQVRWVSTHPSTGGQVQIRIWPVDRNSKRDDLAQPLSECGTGIGQVLAMLYIVFSSTEPRTILIDEPNTFLHPGAVRALLQVFQEHPEHQYFIATHSPTVITAASPGTVLLVRCSASESLVSTIDVKQAASARTYLQEIGASLSDVFGADRILWVEGATEEQCFPKILTALKKGLLMGTIIKGVISTDAFTSKDAKRVIEVYTRLSHADSLLPPALGFIFDSETKTEDEKRDLIKESGDRLRFLPRRMFENYLLHPEAIAEVLNVLDGSGDGSVAEAKVEEMIQVAVGNDAYFKRLPPETPHDLKSIDGAELLRDVFAALTKTRVQFDKVQHSVALCDWVLENEPEQLREVANLIEERMKAGSPQSASA
jgi:hypothetical protein